MSKTLIVKYTPRDGSNTAKITDAFAENLSGDVTVRDLSDANIPQLSSETMKTWWGEGSDTELKQKSDELIAELKDADHIVFAAPMYNWALPSAAKAWFDAVIRGGHTFEFGENGPKGLLTAESATLITTNGMTETGSDSDHLSPNVVQMFGLMGVSDVQVISADKLMMIGDEAAEQAVGTAIEAAKNRAISVA